jgi:hypothetical protein
MIDLILSKENNNGLPLEIINKNIELNNLIIEIIFEINNLNFNYNNIFDLNISKLNKGPRLEIDNNLKLSIIYNFSDNNDPNKLHGYELCNNLKINKKYCLKIFFCNNPYSFKVIFNNETKYYNIININNDKNLNTNDICIAGGFDNTRNFDCGKLYTFNLYKNTNYNEYGILLNFDKIQKFYSNIVYNDKTHNIYRYIMFNNIEKKNIDFLMPNKNYCNRNIINDCRYFLENYNYIFNLNIILNNKPIIYCFLTEEPCELFFSENFSDNHFYEKFLFRVYYFKNKINNNYFMIFTAWEFNIPYFVYYYNTNILYNICLDDPSITQLNNVSMLVNNYIKNNILTKKLENLNLLNSNDIIYGIGYVPNLGHYFWQEILGLIFLIKTNLIMKIKTIIIGKNDCLNFKNILEKEYKHLTIIDGNDFNYSNCIITSLNCTFISNTIAEDFQKIYFKYYNYQKINNYEINNYEINNNNIKVITFIIRNGLPRNVENNFEIIYETIIYFLKKYNNYKLFFYFTGWFFYGNDNNTSLLNYEQNNNNKIGDIQKKFINDIINKVKIIYPDSNIIDMINLNIIDIINIFRITNFLYDETGTSSMFATTIFNYNSIWSTTLPSYDGFLNQSNFLNNKNKTIPIPKKYINMINNNSYNIDKDGYLITLSNINHFQF